MGQIVGTGTISGAIGGAVAVLAIAISARTGTALEPQSPTRVTPQVSASAPSPQTARPAATRGCRADGRLRARHSAHPLGELPRVSQSGQAQGGALAGDLWRRPRRRQGRRGGAPRELGEQPDDRARERRQGDRMPLDELPLSDEQIAHAAAMDRPGRAADADLRGGAGAVGSAARASPPRRYRQRCGRPGSGPPIGSSRRTCRRPACPSRR